MSDLDEVGKEVDALAAETDKVLDMPDCPERTKRLWDLRDKAHQLRVKAFLVATTEMIEIQDQNKK